MSKVFNIACSAAVLLGTLLVSGDVFSGMYGDYTQATENWTPDFEGEFSGDDGDPTNGIELYLPSRNRPFSQQPPSSPLVAPEPGTILLAVSAGMLLLSHRRR